MFVFITEILWRIFWRDKWRSVFDVVQNFHYWVKKLWKFRIRLLNWSLDLASKTSAFNFRIILKIISWFLGILMYFYWLAVFQEGIFLLLWQNGVMLQPCTNIYMTKNQISSFSKWLKLSDKHLKAWSKCLPKFVNNQ